MSRDAGSTLNSPSAEIFLFLKGSLVRVILVLVTLSVQRCGVCWAWRMMKEGSGARAGGGSGGRRLLCSWQPRWLSRSSRLWSRLDGRQYGVLFGEFDILCEGGKEGLTASERGFIGSEENAKAGTARDESTSHSLMSRESCFNDWGLHGSVQECCGQGNPRWNIEVQSPHQRYWHDEHDGPSDNVWDCHRSSKCSFINALSAVDGFVPFVGNRRTLENRHECVDYTSRDDNKADQIGSNSKGSVASGENTDVE